MAGGRNPQKNKGPVPEAGPPLTPFSAWPPVAGPVPGPEEVTPPADDTEPGEG
jgi:hypothetical protein